MMQAKPTSAQEARIDDLAGTYDSVSVRMGARVNAAGEYLPMADVTCWTRRKSGAMYAVDGLTLNPDGSRYPPDVTR